MRTVTLSVGFIPLVDAAPLIIAQELGFAETEGLDLDLVRAPSWSSVRDMLSFGRVDAAHLLSPVPIAIALGLGGAATPLCAVQVLSVNGSMIGLSRALAARLRENGYGFDFKDARAAGMALIKALKGPLRIGIPFPFSMHAELLSYWLHALGAPPETLSLQTIPPAMMANALAGGEIDAFCVGEPWGSIAVDNGVGELLLPGAAIWSFAPEKVLAVRTDWAETEPHLLSRLMRAVWRAERWLNQPDSAITTAEILSRAAYLNVPAEIIDRSLNGRIVISPDGSQRQCDNLILFEKGAATFPWRSQASWIGARLARRSGLNLADSVKKARAVFRSDLYRQALTGFGTDIPAASDKLEGAIEESTPAASATGRLYLQHNRFFDGKIFDPMAPDA